VTVILNSPGNPWSPSGLSKLKEIELFSCSEIFISNVSFDNYIDLDFSNFEDTHCKIFSSTLIVRNDSLTDSISLLISSIVLLISSISVLISIIESEFF
jgi:hypothetical protein